MSSQMTDLPEILGDFYFSLKKAKIKNPSDTGEYKSNIMMCICAALNRYFKEHRGIDIISNPKFILSNENFQAVTRHGKKEGKGEIDYHEAISSED